MHVEKESGSYATFYNHCWKYKDNVTSASYAPFLGGKSRGELGTSAKLERARAGNEHEPDGKEEN